MKHTRVGIAAYIGMCLLTLTLTHTTSAQTLAMGPCETGPSNQAVAGAKCGMLEVLENYSDPTSPKISIKILRIASIREASKAPIFFIAGGPGQASTEIAQLIRRQFPKLLKDHDFVFVDQRGTGESNPLDCDTEQLSIAHLAPEEASDLALAGLKRCLSEYSAQLAFYSTPHAVKDLDEVRKALGYDSIQLWGGSYGTRVALEYIRQFPQNANAAVLDGLAPPAIELPKYISRDASRALENVFTDCSADVACSKAFPGLKTTWISLLKTLASTPRTIELRHPRTQQSHKVYIDHHVVSSWVHLILYARDAAPILPLSLHRATQGDFSQLFSFFASGLDNQLQNMYEGMQLAVLCAEDYALSQKTPNKTVVTTTSPLLSPNLQQLLKACELFPKSNVDDAYFELSTRETPVLLLSGNNDPVTPPSWAEYVKPYFPNSQHIVVAGGNHNVSALGCLPKLILNFFDSPREINTLDTSCADTIKTPHYFIDGAGPELRSQSPANTEIAP